MPRISVFTPSYNRAGKIHRVFNSLQQQSFKDFEWIIVDDGSTDNTKEVIEQFRQTDPGFSIAYVYQENAGKHIAINRGVSMAAGEWFHIADSDDELEPETLMAFMDTWEKIPAEQKHEYGGIIACVKDQYGNRISNQVPGGVFDGYLKDLFYKYKFRKEFFHIYKTSAMREFPFPSDIKRTLVPEGLTWRKISGKYKIRAINDVLRIYFVHEGTDSLMFRKNKSPESKAFTNCIESSGILNSDLRYFIYWSSHFLKMAMLYYSFLPFLNEKQRSVVRLSVPAFFFSLPFIIPGYFFSKILSAKFKKEQIN